MAALILLALLGSRAFGQGDPAPAGVSAFDVVGIDGPDETEAGRLVVLDSSAIPADGRAWNLANPPADDNHQTDKSGERLFFATSVPGVYFFQFAFAKPAAEGEASGVVIVSHVLTVRGSNPGPNPGPNPRPRPVIPDGRFGLAKVAAAELLKLPAGVRGSAAAVAGAHRAVSSQIAAGALDGFPRVLSALQSRLREVLGRNFESWKPWGQSVMGSVSELYQAGKLKTETDLAEALSEIADGLTAGTLQERNE